MSSIIPNIREVITTRQLILPGEKIIAAVSGGVDSMVMLDILRQLAREWPFDLSVLHINHGIRGDASDRDEQLVRNTAAEYGLECYVRKLEGFDSSSSEDRLRKARYEQFERALQETGAHKMATAHQLNDQLETFLMRLSTGASLNGLTSIPEIRGPYIRPMLKIHRQAIVTYAAEHDIPYREDSSNRDEQKLRNLIRHRLVPAMESSLGSGFLDGFSKSLDELQAVNTGNRKAAKSLFEQMATVNEDMVTLPVEAVLALDSYLRKQVVEYCIYSFYKVYSGLDIKRFLEFEKFLKTAMTGSRFFVSNQILADKDRGTLTFSKKTEEIPEHELLYPGKSVCIARNIIAMNEVTPDKIVQTSNSNEEYICGDEIHTPLTVRFWKEGDVFVPLGMNHAQKLSDFFVNNKVARRMKRQIPLVCNGDEIVWIAGYRLDERYKITEQSNQFYRLSMEQAGKE